ncbi:MAG TPA: VOC family protein, partial [Candidatus Eisenbacteria bacterium]|nr:VOC family protein [Candidatus Eisenbacteria bacterium]
MIKGMHAIVYSRDAEADRRFFRDVLGWPFVDAHGGWLIFAQPPAELAVHPIEGAERHELFLMCDDVEATVAELRDRGVGFSTPISDEDFGRLTHLRLPGGGELGLYEPRHASPLAAFGESRGEP